MSSIRGLSAQSQATATSTAAALVLPPKKRPRDAAVTDTSSHPKRPKTASETSHALCVAYVRGKEVVLGSSAFVDSSSYLKRCLELQQAADGRVEIDLDAALLEQALECAKTNRVPQGWPADRFAALAHMMTMLDFSPGMEAAFYLQPYREALQQALRGDDVPSQTSAYEALLAALWKTHAWDEVAELWYARLAQQPPATLFAAQWTKAHQPTATALDWFGLAMLCTAWHQINDASSCYRHVQRLEEHFEHTPETALRLFGGADAHWAVALQEAHARQDIPAASSLAQRWRQALPSSVAARLLCGDLAQRPDYGLCFYLEAAELLCAPTQVFAALGSWEQRYAQAGLPPLHAELLTALQSWQQSLQAFQGDAHELAKQLENNLGALNAQLNTLPRMYTLQQQRALPGAARDAELRILCKAAETALVTLKEADAAALRTARASYVTTLNMPLGATLDAAQAAQIGSLLLAHRCGYMQRALLTELIEKIALWPPAALGHLAQGAMEPLLIRQLEGNMVTVQNTALAAAVDLLERHYPNVGVFMQRWRNGTVPQRAALLPMLRQFLARPRTAEAQTALERVLLGEQVFDAVFTLLGPATHRLNAQVTTCLDALMRSIMPLHEAQPALQAAWSEAINNTYHNNLTKLSDLFASFTVALANCQHATSGELSLYLSFVVSMVGTSSIVRRLLAEAHAVPSLMRYISAERRLSSAREITALTWALSILEFQSRQLAGATDDVAAAQRQLMWQAERDNGAPLARLAADARVPANWRQRLPQMLPA